MEQATQPKAYPWLVSTVDRLLPFFLTRCRVLSRVCTRAVSRRVAPCRERSRRPGNKSGARSRELGRRRSIADQMMRSPSILCRFDVPPYTEARDRTAVSVAARFEDPPIAPSSVRVIPPLVRASLISRRAASLVSASD